MGACRSHKELPKVERSGCHRISFSETCNNSAFWAELPGGRRSLRQCLQIVLGAALAPCCGLGRCLQTWMSQRRASGSVSKQTVYFLSGLASAAVERSRSSHYTAVTLVEFVFTMSVIHVKTNVCVCMSAQHVLLVSGPVPSTCRFLENCYLKQIKPNSCNFKVQNDRMSLRPSAGKLSPRLRTTPATRLPGSALPRPPVHCT